MNSLLQFTEVSLINLLELRRRFDDSDSRTAQLPAPDPTAPVADACGAAQYAALVGKPVTEPGVPPEGPTVRHIRPDTQVTMDFRPDRLNIDIDAAGVITGFRCT